MLSSSSFGPCLGLAAPPLALPAASQPISSSLSRALPPCGSALLSSPHLQPLPRPCSPFPPLFSPLPLPFSREAAGCSLACHPHFLGAEAAAALARAGRPSRAAPVPSSLPNTRPPPPSSATSKPKLSLGMVPGFARKRSRAILRQLWVLVPPQPDPSQPPWSPTAPAVSWNTQRLARLRLVPAAPGHEPWHPISRRPLNSLRPEAPPPQPGLHARAGR